MSPLEVVTDRHQEEARKKSGPPLVADRVLFLTGESEAGDPRRFTEPGQHVVEAGDPRARFRFTSPGHEITLADAERYGLTLEDGRIVINARTPESADPGTKSEEKTEDKEAGKPADKQADKPADKSRRRA